MNEELHEKATMLFGAAMELEQEAAKAFILQETKGNKELEEYTLKLYSSFVKEKEHFPEAQQEQTNPTLKELVHHKEEKTSTLKPFIQKNKKSIGVIVVGLLLIISGFIYGTYVRNELIQSEVNEHLAILRANEKILQQWINNEKMKVEDLSTFPSIQEINKELNRKYDQEENSFLEKSDNDFLQYTSELNKLSKREQILGIGILHRSTPITLISNALLEKEDLSILNGKMLAEGAYPTYLKVLAGNTVFTPPIELSQQVFQTGDKVDNYTSECHFSTPIYEKGKVSGVFTMSLSTKETFGQLFRSTVHGNSSEVYAFNKKGQMLSTSRFIEELQDAGLLKEAKSSILNVLLKVPNSQKFTSLFQQIQQDLEKEKYSDVLITPYTNYLGEEVMGAWIWFPEYNIGLIHEQNYNEFDRSIFLFDMTYLLTVFIIIIMGIIVIRSNFKFNLLQKKYTSLKELGQYHLKDKIGEGGFGEVYKGEHRLLKKPVAIKILKKELNGTDALDRFKKEVMVTASLDHPNTIRVYDYGTGKDGQFYYVMEYLNGLSLESILYQEEKMSVDRGLYILLKVCKSLEEAHKKGLLHRDIKPANIMVCNQGGAYDIIKLLDFGLVKDVNTSISQQTQINRIGGTPMFMAPERLHDPYNADVRQDIYAIGAVGLYMFSGKYIVELISQKMLMGQESIENLLTNDIFEGIQLPSALVQLLFSCVSFDVEERPQNIQDLIQQLELIASDFQWTEKEAKYWWEKYDQYSYSI